MILNINVFFIALFVLCAVQSAKLPKNIQKKVFKEVENTFNSKDYHIEGITVGEDVDRELSKRIGADKLFRIISQDSILGYAYIDKAPSKTDQFDYLVLFDKNLFIVNTKVLIYREDYGGEIASKRWLKQFIGKSVNDELVYKRDIDAISGATISAYSMTKEMNNLLKAMGILQKNKII